MFAPDQSVPNSFYFFSALNSDARKQWIQQLLVDHKAYFRSREQLNDPNELRPSIIFEGTDKDIRLFVRQLILDRWPTKLSPANRLREESKLVHRYRNTPEWVEDILHKILDRIGVFCLSETATEPLLWSHYADGHRGIGIEFDANSGLFIAAQRVVYSNEAPVINRLMDDQEAILTKSMFMKNSPWAYEREWRIIARWDDKVRIAKYIEQHINTPDALKSFIREQHGPGHYVFPPEAIRSIVLGTRTTASDETWVRSLLAETKQEIPLLRAVIKKDGNMTIPQ